MKKIRKHSQILFLLGLMVFLVAGCKKNKPENEIVRLFTNEISQVTNNSAVVSGKVISNIPLDEVGVCYGINAMPTIESEKKEASVENTLFSCELSNLQSDKTYYVRTYAVTTNGNIYYGNEESFNTVFANPPTVNLTADKTTITSGETVAFTIQADANAETMKNITTVRIDVVLNNENLYTDGSVVNAATYSKVVELKFEGYEGDAFEVSVTATDEAGEKATATVTVTIDAGALVLVESPFTWNRHGPDPATGLDSFGLAWLSNESKAMYAKITPLAGAKLYRFTTAQYVAALTQFQKVALFEGATEISEWKEFNVFGQESQDLDVVLGTEFQGVFHLIHITHGEYSTFKGTDATITGMAK